MGKKSGKVYVVGHKNPDTDSICSAIAYAHLKKEITGEEYVPRRAGLINEETAYVLQRFGVDAPPLLQNVKLQVKDIDIHKIDGVDPQMSIKDTWQKMKENNIKTIPVLKDEELVGVISTGDIATSYMDVYDNRVLSAAKTQYRNIIKTLDGTLVTGNEHGHFTKGKVAIGASNPDLMEQFIEKDDLVILGNRYESQACAVDIDASCLVVCQNAEVPDELIKKAEEQSIVIIRTPHDTFTVARLINQSMPISYFMKTENLVTFVRDDYIEDIREVMASKRYRDFPVLDKEGKYATCFRFIECHAAGDMDAYLDLCEREYAKLPEDLQSTLMYNFAELVGKDADARARAAKLVRSHLAEMKTGTVLFAAFQLQDLEGEDTH